MQIIGEYLTRTSNEADLRWFMDVYEIHPEVYKSEYELVPHKLPKHIKAIIHVNSDGHIDQQFIIEEGDEVTVWSGGCCDTTFNTDGMAFLEVVGGRTGTFAQWVLDNSPYELDADDFNDMGTSPQKLLSDGLFQLSKERLLPSEVIFVTQL